MLAVFCNVRSPERTIYIRKTDRKAIEMARRRKGLTFYQKKKKMNVSLIKEIFSWLFWCAASALLAVVMVYCIGMKTSVIGASMEPALYNGQEIFLNRFVYKFLSPSVGDVVVFKPNGNENAQYYVKRVVAVPGDTVQIKEGRLYVNNELADDDGTYDKIADPGLAVNEILLQEDEYFVLGDNRNNSEDSRSANIGNIRKEYILGKAWYHMAQGKSGIGFLK